MRRGHGSRDDDGPVWAEEERAVLCGPQRLRVESVCGRSLLRKRLRWALSKLRPVGLAGAVRERGKRGCGSEANLPRQRQGIVWDEWRMRWNRCLPEVRAGYGLRHGSLPGGCTHPGGDLQSIRPMCHAARADVQSVHVQRLQLLRHLFDGHAMRGWERLFQFLLRAQALGRRM